MGEARGVPKATDFRPGPQGATGGHVCGRPEWFRDGLPAGPFPPVRYNADGLPACCAPGMGLLWGEPADAGDGGLLWGGGGADVHGTDSCFGSPVLAPNVVYTQPPEVMGPVGNGLWFDLGVMPSGASGLEVIDLGGLNPVSALLFKTGSSCFDATTVSGASGPPFVVDTSGWDGFHGYVVVFPTTLGAGAISPTFTISFTN